MRVVVFKLRVNKLPKNIENCTRFRNNVVFYDSLYLNQTQKKKKKSDNYSKDNVKI